MSKFKIEIAEPCHENWEAMTKSEQGKFCGSCQKNVVDFTHYSNYEIGQFLGKPENANTCGRFLPSQIQETYNYYQPEKSSNFLKYAAGLAGTLLLVQAFDGCKEAPKQCEVKVEQDATIESETIFSDLSGKLKDKQTICGIVINKQTGKPFVDPKIEIFTFIRVDTSSFKGISTFIDKNGFFKLNYQSEKEETLKFFVHIYKDTTIADRYGNVFTECVEIHKGNFGNIHRIEIDTINDRNTEGIVGQASCIIVK